MFFAMREFIEQKDSGDGETAPHTVCISTESGARKEFNVLDLTRWCTDNAEKIAMELAAVGKP